MSQNLLVADFQSVIEGKRTDLFFLENRHGVRAGITNYGARLVALWMPDKENKPDNIVAGYDSLAGYLSHDESYLGAMIGRYANRIANASFKLNGKSYSVTANEGRHHLHGGRKGFHNVVWEAEQTDRSSVRLEHKSANGEEGFPGNIKVEVTYTLTDDEELIIESKAISDRDTILNITNHSYFNLGGETGNTSARTHELMVNAHSYLPVTENKIPLGRQESVEGSPFDFREFQVIAEKLDPNERQIVIGEGYDHTFVLNKTAAENINTCILAARIKDSFSGRILEVKTTEPGLQFFECEFPQRLDLNLNSAICLETQHFPDSPNNPHFPSTVLQAGDEFYSKTIMQNITAG